MSLGLRGIEDFVEQLMEASDEDIDRIAEELVLQGKEPDQIIPAMNALSKNQQIWNYDFEGNMEGQSLAGAEPEQVAPNAEATQVLQQAAQSADVANQALAGYLAGQPAAPKQPIQYASGATVGNAAAAGTPTANLFQQPQGGATPGLGAILARGQRNG